MKLRQALRVFFNIFLRAQVFEDALQRATFETTPELRYVPQDRPRTLQLPTSDNSGTVLVDESTPYEVPWDGKVTKMNSGNC